MTRARTAFELLFDIDQRCRSLAAGLPSQDAAGQSWSGIGFRLGEHLFVAPMGEIVEILNEPRAAAMPGVKSWVVGIANLRGRLLPVMDLGRYLGQERRPLRKQRRVLVVEHQDIFAGLLVDEVLGMQHFEPDHLLAGANHPFGARIAPFICGQFQADAVWQVLSTRALVQSADFIDVAV